MAARRAGALGGGFIPDPTNPDPNEPSSVAGHYHPNPLAEDHDLHHHGGLMPNGGPLMGNGVGPPTGEGRGGFGGSMRDVEYVVEDGDGGGFYDKAMVDYDRLREDREGEEDPGMQEDMVGQHNYIGHGEIIILLSGFQMLIR